MKFLGSYIDEKIKQLFKQLNCTAEWCGSAAITAIVVSLALFVIFWLALFLHLAFVHTFLPTKIYEWPLHLGFRSCDNRPGLCSDPTASVALTSNSEHWDAHSIDSSWGRCKKEGKYAHQLKQEIKRHTQKNSGKEGNKWGEELEELLEHDGGEHPPPPSTSSSSKCEEGGGYISSSNTNSIFSRGQRYSISVSLVMPDSPANRDMGMFSVSLYIRDTSGHVLRETNRPALLPYRSTAQRLMSAARHIPTMIFSGSYDEIHDMKISLVDGYVDATSTPAHSVTVVLHSRYVHVHSCTLHVHATFTGLRHMLHTYPVLCAAVGTLFNMMAMAVVAAAVWWRRQEILARAESTRAACRVYSSEATRSEEEVEETGCSDVEFGTDMEGDGRDSEDTEGGGMGHGENTNSACLRSEKDAEEDLESHNSGGCRVVELGKTEPIPQQELIQKQEQEVTPVGQPLAKQESSSSSSTSLCLSSSASSKPSPPTSGGSSAEEDFIVMPAHG